MTFLTRTLSALLIVVSAHVFAQTNLVTNLPKTEYGYPDFQGYWENLHQTPLQRPEELGDRQAYSEEEAFALIEQASASLRKRSLPLDPDREPPQEGRVTNQADDDFDDFPIDIAMINGEYRTSLIIDPPNGRIPHDIVNRAQTNEFYFYLEDNNLRFDGPEAAYGGERCLFPGPQLSMMYQRGLSPYTQIVQTKDYLMILGEYPYHARIIRIESDHPATGFAKWMGDSVGHWENQTLVIHTDKIRREQSFPPIFSTVNTQITERLSLGENGTLVYEYTVTDPELYLQSFTAQIPFTRMHNGQVIYEYACHEGNYSFVGSLAGARWEDAQSEIDNDAN